MAEPSSSLPQSGEDLKTASIDQVLCWLYDTELQVDDTQRLERKIDILSQLSNS